MITWSEHNDNIIGAGKHITVNYDTHSEHDQLRVLLNAASLFAERNEGYRDNWKRQGWRGSLFKLRLKVERAWDVLWAWPLDEDEPNPDDLLDAINYAAFAVRQLRDGDRDGSWEYPA